MRRTRLGPVIPWLLGALLVLGLAAIAWVGIRGAMAYADLQSARTALVAFAKSPMDAGESNTQVERAGESLRSAHELTSDPVWRAAERLPWLGPQLDAFGQVAAAGNDVAVSALQPLSKIASSVSLESLRPVNGALDLTALRAIQHPASQAAAALDAASHRIDAIDRTGLLSPLSQGIDLLDQQITSASAIADTATLLPTMLGGDKPRTWLLLVQNNAELRSLGGMPGAVAVITATNGHLALTAQGDAVIPPFDPPVTDLGHDLLGALR